MRNYAKFILRLVVGILAIVIMMANTGSASAGGPDEPTPTPLPSVGIAATSTSVAVTVNTQPNAQFFSQSTALVWEGPGIGKVIAQLPLNAGVYITSWTSDGQWALINDGSGTDWGWTSAANLRNQPRPTGSPATSTVTLSSSSALATGTGHIGTMYVTTSLNRRTGPGTTFSIDGAYPYRTAVSIIGWDNTNYWALTSDGYWLGSAYLSLTVPSTATRAAVNATAAAAPTTATSSGTCTGGWPSTPEQAHSYFGGGTWEISPEGGWHMFEVHDAVPVNPCNNTMEGYFDTAPGRDPIQFVSTTTMNVQGATIWNSSSTSPEALFCAMDAQKGHPTGPRAIQAIGFSPVACP